MRRNTAQSYQKHEIMPFAAATWVDLEIIILRRKSGETSII